MLELLDSFGLKVIRRIQGEPDYFGESSSAYIFKKDTPKKSIEFVAELLNKPAELIGDLQEIFHPPYDDMSDVRSIDDFPDKIPLQ